VSAASPTPPRPPTPPSSPRPESDAFDPDGVLYHANGLLVLDKPAGVPVHAGEGHPSGLVEDVKEWVTRNPGVLDVAPGAKLHPMNLLEREASGVLVIALSKKVARRVKAAIDETTSEFAAVIAGPLASDGAGARGSATDATNEVGSADDASSGGASQDEASHGEIRGRIRSRVGGRFRRVEASLTYRVLRTDERLSLVVARPDGHRAHQVRALFASAGRPLAGDDRFGKPAPAEKFREKFEDWEIDIETEVKVGEGSAVEDLQCLKTDD